MEIGAVLIRILQKANRGAFAGLANPEAAAASERISLAPAELSHRAELGAGFVEGVSGGGGAVYDCGEGVAGK